VGGTLLAKRSFQRDRRIHGLAFGNGPTKNSFCGQLQNGPPILRENFEPSELIHHWEVDSAETQTSEKDVDTVAERLVIQRVDGVSERSRV